MANRKFVSFAPLIAVLGFIVLLTACGGGPSVISPVPLVKERNGRNGVGLASSGAPQWPMLLTGKARSATVIARRNGEAVFLNRDQFFLLLEKEPAVVREILRRLACRIVRLTEQVKILGVKPGRGCKRIATALLLFEDFPEYCPSGLTKAYLSRFCGLSWQQTLRILKEFKENGWVDLPSHSHEIVVQNPEGLRKFIAEEREK